MQLQWPRTLLYMVACCVCLARVSASDLDEFKVKRQETFEFTEKPGAERHGDKVRITFASKAYCDVAVTVEDEAGRIQRHIAAGVLGPNAPDPLQKNALKQSIVWDGKDDQGRYLDNPDQLKIRVSLGLKPQFERTLFWEPKKRTQPGNRMAVAFADEGVYVHDGGGVDHVRLFSHEGEYLRTVWPPPASKLDSFKDLRWAEAPEDGKRLPLKNGIVQATFFTSGNNIGEDGGAKYGCAASTMAVYKDRVAMMMRKLNRFLTDSSSSGLKLDGPKTELPAAGEIGKGPEPAYAAPRSAAFSPDGKYIYLTGFRGNAKGEWFSCVLKFDYQSDEAPKVFAGGLKEEESGDAPGKFRVPLALSVDNQGRVFVADYMNDRIQVFDADGKFLKAVPVKKPASVAVSPENGELYVCSWMITNRFWPGEPNFKDPTFSRLKSMDDPRVLATGPLPLSGHFAGIFMNRNGGLQHDVWVDFHTNPPTLWIVPGTAGTDNKLLLARGDYKELPTWEACSLHLFVEKNGKLELKKSFGDDAKKTVARVTPPVISRQRLYVNPATGLLYVAEGDSGVMKSFKQLVEIDPKTGLVKLIDLPFTAEDLAFDLNGLVYLRTDTDIVRYNFETWREVPFDYGEERTSVGFDDSVKTAKKVLGSIYMPCARPGQFHFGGFAVSPKGYIVAHCHNPEKATTINMPGSFQKEYTRGKAYTAPVFPGRYPGYEIHVWDPKGKILFEDAAPGIHLADGLAMDRDDRLYVMAANVRLHDGKELCLERSETILKLAPKQGKLISSVQEGLMVPLAPSSQPQATPQLAKNHNGKSWVEGVDWMYGGVGYGGFNSAKGGGGCACWNARFALDYHARTFAPEVDHFSVAVLDANGNLIMRIGQYGNADDGKPLELAGGPANPHSVGGDEVALMHAAYVAVDSDKRLFIADAGNARVLSVKLSYAANEYVALKDVPKQEAAAPAP